MLSLLNVENAEVRSMLVFCPSRRSRYVFHPIKSYWEPQSFIHWIFVLAVGRVIFLSSAATAQRVLDVRSFVATDWKQDLHLKSVSTLSSTVCIWKREWSYPKLSKQELLSFPFVYHVCYRDECHGKAR